MFYMVLDVGNGYQLHLSQWVPSTEFKFFRENEYHMEILQSYLIINPDAVELEREMDESEFDFYWQYNGTMGDYWVTLPKSDENYPEYEDNIKFRRVAKIL